MMQIFLGVEPPDPPPNVPDVQAKTPPTRMALTKPTMRQQMEMHRKNEPCATLPQDHGPDRILAGKFRRDRASGASPTTAARSIPPACWWTAAKLTA